MGNFAFIFCPTTTSQLKRLKPLYRFLPDIFAAPALKKITPFKALNITKIRSIDGKEIEGNIFACPVSNGTCAGAFFDKIIDAAGMITTSNPGILGLDSCANPTEEERLALLKRMNIPLTNGAAFTAWSLFEAAYRICKAKNLELKKSSLAIIGATGSIGNALTKKLSDYAAKLFLTSGEPDKLRQLKDAITSVNPLEIITDPSTQQAVKSADIIIHISGEFNAEDLKPGAIVCSLHTFCRQPSPPQGRTDITFIKAGLIKLPYPLEPQINLGLPKNIIFASLAEVILLALEGKFTSYSLSDNINPDKLEEIANIAVRAGFEIWVPEAPVL